MSRNVKKHTCTFNWTCALSKDSDQPAHLLSLIRIFIRCILASHGCKVLKVVNEELSDCPDVRADLSLLWAHMSEGTFSDVVAHIFVTIYVLSCVAMTYKAST